MSSFQVESTPSNLKTEGHTTVYPILFSIAFAHLLNDLLQAVIPASYPILKLNFHLSFTQIGLITLSYQLAASILQPIIGLYTDKRPKPFSQIFGMLFTLSGIVMLSYAAHFQMIIASGLEIIINKTIFILGFVFALNKIKQNEYWAKEAIN